MRLTLQSGDVFALNAGTIGKVLMTYQEPSFPEQFFEDVPLTTYTDRTIVDPDLLMQEYERIREAGSAYSHGEITPDASSVAFRSSTRLEGSNTAWRPPVRRTGSTVLGWPMPRRF